jgi:hypothetical protein
MLCALKLGKALVGMVALLPLCCHAPLMVGEWFKGDSQ